jgi:hypothetical protein
MSTQHIGAAGELLVQYELLKLEIDSARLTTDSGVDLVVYTPSTGKAKTVQVKTVRSPTPAGGRGRAAIGWTFPDSCKADLLAVTLLSANLVWLFTLDEARELAQQHTAQGSRRLYWYTDESQTQVNGVPLRQSDMESHLLAARAPVLFPA